MTRPLDFPRLPTDAVIEGRLDMLERRSLTRPQIDQQPAEQPVIAGGSRSDEIVIASVTSTDKAIAGADYVIDSDYSNPVGHIDFQAALDEIHASYFGCGTAVVMAGDYYFGAHVNIPNGVSVRGQGHGWTQIMNFVGSDSVFVLNATDCELVGLYLDSNGPYVVDANGRNGFVVDRCYVGAILLSGGTFRMTNSFSYIIDIAGQGEVANCSIYKVNFKSTSWRSRMTGCTDGTGGSGNVIVIEGTDNAMSDCTLIGRAPFAGDNTGRTVWVKGTRNNFSGHNVVRSGNALLRPAYAVEIDAAAVDARVVDNDLRPGAGGSWGTAALLDSGTTSITRNND